MARKKKRAYSSGNKPRAEKRSRRLDWSPDEDKQPISVFDDPILEEVCKTIECFDMGPQIAKWLLATLAATKNGVGLAAPQIGLAVRAVLVKPNRRLAGTVMFNPRIDKASDRLVDGSEGCLSFPGFNTNVKRPSSVKVVYQDMDGVKQAKFFSGWDARIACHEIEHLDGVCHVGDAWKAAGKAANEERKLESQTT